MKKETKRIRSRLKMVVATMTAVFSLATAFIATYAWFSFNQQVSVTGAFVSVVTKDYRLESVDMYKFNYAKDEYGDEDGYLFLNPEKGGLDKYRYLNDAFVDDQGKTTTAMNIYDPLERIISGNSFKLSQFNSNAIYEVTISTSSDISYANLDVSSFINVLEREENEYYLSDYVDFDIFTEDDLVDKVNDSRNSVFYDNNGVSKYLPNTNVNLPANYNYNCAIDVTRLMSGDGTPTSSFGVIDDRYFDYTNGILYEKGLDGWGVVEGITESDDNPNTESVSGSDGDYYIYKPAEGDSVFYTYLEDQNPWKILEPAFSGRVVPWQYAYGGETVNEDDLFLYTYIDDETERTAAKLYIRLDSNDDDEEEGWDELTSYYFGMSPNLSFAFKRNVNPTSPSYEEGINDGDLYLNTSNNKVFIASYDEENERYVWSEVGINYSYLDGSSGDYYIDISGSDSVLYIYDKDPSWSVAPTIATGEGQPDSNSGDVDGAYVDILTNDYYYKESTGWHKQSRVASGSDTPDNELDTDYYICTTLEDGHCVLYIKDNGLFDALTYETDYTQGSGAPANNTGSENDLYVDVSQYALYKKDSSGGWAKQSNLTHEELYYKISYLSSLKQSHAHFYGLDEDTISLTPKNTTYKNTSGTWNSFDPTYSGTELPPNNVGSRDDTYFDYSEYKAYVRTSSGWVDKDAITGATNPDNSVDHSTSDYYLNTTNNSLFRYVEDTEPWKKVDVDYISSASPDVYDEFDEGYPADGQLYLKTGGDVLVIYSYDETNTEWDELTTFSFNINPNVNNLTFAFEDTVDPTSPTTEEGIHAGDLYLNTTDNSVFVASYDEDNEEYVWNEANISYDENLAYLDGTTGDYFVDTSSAGIYYIYVFDKNSQPWKSISPTFSLSRNPNFNEENSEINSVFVNTSSKKVFVKESTGWEENPTSVFNDVPSSGENGDYGVDLSTNLIRVPFKSSGNIEDTRKYAKIYINVNYAPRQLEQYNEDTNEKITANIDFAFAFKFFEVN